MEILYIIIPCVFIFGLIIFVKRKYSVYKLQTQHYIDVIEQQRALILELSELADPEIVLARIYGHQDTAHSIWGGGGIRGPLWFWSGIESIYKETLHNVEKRIQERQEVFHRA